MRSKLFAAWKKLEFVKAEDDLHILSWPRIPGLTYVHCDPYDLEFTFLNDEIEVCRSWYDEDSGNVYVSSPTGGVFESFGLPFNLKVAKSRLLDSATPRDFDYVSNVNKPGVVENILEDLWVEFGDCA